MKQTEQSGFCIRPLERKDAARTAQICQESLGYPLTTEQAAENIERIQGSPHAALLGLFITPSENQQPLLAGLIQLLEYHPVYGKAQLEVVALAVHPDWQNRKYGEKLLQEAQNTAAAKGIECIRVTSSLKRTRAHRFYLRHGYSKMKESAIFEK